MTKAGLKKCKTNGIKLNIRKCQLRKKEVNFLVRFCLTNV